MVFGTILTSGQEVPVDTSSSATGVATFALNEEGTALNYSLTVDGLDFGAFIGNGTPQTEDTFDDVLGIDLGNAPLGETGDVAFGIVGLGQDDDLMFVSNPDGSTTISGTWAENDLASIPLSTFIPGIQSAAATTAESGAVQITDLYLNVRTAGYPEGAIRGQMASISPELSEWLLTADPIVLNGLIGQYIPPI